MVETRERRKKDTVQARTPARIVIRGGKRRTTVPWRRDAIKPMRERRRPFKAEGLDLLPAYSVAVRKGRENSNPEKGRRKSR
jgi:hypothetical protein